MKNEKELASAITSLTGAVAAMAKAHPSFLAAGSRGTLAFLQEASTEGDGALRRSLAALPPRLLWHASLTEVRWAEAEHPVYRQEGYNRTYGRHLFWAQAFGGTLRKDRSSYISEEEVRGLQRFNGGS